MVFLEWVGTGLLFFGHKVKFVARAYEYQAGSDRVCLYADSFLTLTTTGPICHSDLCWPIEKKNHDMTPNFFWLNLKEENVLIKIITTLGVKG